jgi:hypothetical protein
MQPDQETGLPTLNGLSGPGRPTKRTKKVVAELLDAISAGAPFNLACQAAGIAHQTFQDWRRRDPVFALQVDQAAARGTIGRLKEIEAQGKDGAWQALSWLCERRHPAEFAKPEVALNIGIQNNLNATANGGGFESLVVSDLEFLGLRQKEGYEHRPHARQTREVEAEVVPIDLSGALAVQGHPGSAVVSKTQAEATQARVEKADARIEELLKARRAGNGNGNGAPADPTSSAMVLPPIVMPPEPVPSHWWAQLVRGDNTREVERTTAIKIVRQILSDVVGQLRSQNTPVEFAPGVPILLRDVHQALDAICGADCWSALRRRGEA